MCHGRMGLFLHQHREETPKWVWMLAALVPHAFPPLLLHNCPPPSIAQTMHPLLPEPLQGFHPHHHPADSDSVLVSLNASSPPRSSWAFSSRWGSVTLFGAVPTLGFTHTLLYIHWKFLSSGQVPFLEYKCLKKTHLSHLPLNPCHLAWSLAPDNPQPIFVK